MTLVVRTKLLQQLLSCIVITRFVELSALGSWMETLACQLYETCDQVKSATEAPVYEYVDN